MRVVEEKKSEDANKGKVYRRKYFPGKRGCRGGKGESSRPAGGFHCYLCSKPEA